MTLRMLLPESLLGVIGLALIGLVTYQASIYLYNLFLHPLATFPGPKIAAASYTVKFRLSTRGEYVRWVVRQHEKYGEVVRVSPNELSFSGAEAFRDIYGHKTNLNKYLKNYPTFEDEPDNIIVCDQQNHARQRRVFVHAFSDRALKLQEPMFLQYVKLLVQNIHAEIQNSSTSTATQDAVKLFNFTTFDIMGDLTFGDPLNMLQNADYHPWVKAIFENIKLNAWSIAFKNYPAFEKALKPFTPKTLKEQFILHKSLSKDRVVKRLSKTSPRPDIWGLTIPDGEKKAGLTREEMYANSDIFMTAGTETTATLLSGLTYYLLKNPSKMRRLVSEIRREIQTENEITIEKLQSLPYLFCCIEEALRVYPPAPGALYRVTGETSVIIDGHEIPPHAGVAVTQLAAYRNPKNFKHPYEFIPERWEAGNKEFASDKKQAFQPFSTGPRNCLGQNLAYHEMRIIITTLLWHFDLELCDENQRWEDQLVFFVLWEKHPLMVRIKAAERHL